MMYYVLLVTLPLSGGRYLMLLCTVLYVYSTDRTIIVFWQHHVDPAIGVYIIDRFTYYALEFLERVTPDSKKTLAQFVSALIFVIFYT